MLPRIDSPTLLIHGEATQRSSLDIANELHAAIRGSQLTVMPGLGHECYVESAEAFDSVVSQLPAVRQRLIAR